MEETQYKHKKEVIKHSAAIQIQNSITLLQRRVWNILLYHAYNELPSSEEHCISILELARSLEYDSNNHEYLKETLRTLVTFGVEWNVLEKDGVNIWGVSTLLAHAEIKQGVCFYSYSVPLRQRLYNPSIYARLDLNLQNRFKSKHTQALWELCIDYLGDHRENGETPYISVEKFKKLMGISEDAYTLFKLLSQWVIKPALTEINSIPNFRVEIEYQRQGRKVTALKFKICRIKPPPARIDKQGNLFSDRQDIPPAVKLLKEAGLSSNDAWDVWEKGVDYIEADDKPGPEAFESYLQEKIDLLKHRQQAGKVESATGFLLSAIRYNYAPSKAVKTVSKRRQAKRTQARAERQAELRERFAEHREQVFWRRFEERPEAWRAEQRQRFEAMLQGDPIHRFVWQSYREHGSLQSPSIAAVFMQMLADELLLQPEEISLEAFAAWVDEAA